MHGSESTVIKSNVGVSWLKIIFSVESSQALWLANIGCKNRILAIFVLHGNNLKEGPKVQKDIVRFAENTFLNEIVWCNDCT